MTGIRVVQLQVLLYLLCCGVLSEGFSEKELGELEVGLEFMEFDLEDRCLARNDALWAFYSGSTKDLNQLIEQEAAHAALLKKEISEKLNFKEAKLANNKTQRILKILFSSGPVLLDGAIFKEFTTFAAEAQKASSIPTSSKNLTYQKVQEILATEKNDTVLADTWTNWAQDVQYSSRDLTQQISMLDLEAEANGAESVEKYWLEASEVTTTDYDGISKLWATIVPLYQRLRQLLATRIASKFNAKVFVNPKLIPVHVLGSLDSSDWATAAGQLDALKQSKTFTSFKSALKTKKTKDIYSAADEITAELRLGYLPENFFQNSVFAQNTSSCVHFVEGTCKLGSTPRALHCRDEAMTINTFLRAHEEVGHMKHLAMAAEEEAGNGFLLREGPRDSVLYEAISTATSLLALHPENLRRRGFLSSLDQDANMTSLLLAALHIIPPLPLHLSYDLWRLQALKADREADETTVADITTITAATTESEDEEKIEEVDTEKNVTRSVVVVNETDTEPTVSYQRENLTADWWSIRGKLQGVSPPGQKLYEDFLQDQRVVWNKPHISKFLGPILLFQILEHFKTGNTTENLDLLQKLLRKGKSEPWEKMVADLFNITELSTQPLLNYFKPLEAFLDSGAKFQGNTTSSSGFNENDFKLFLQSTSLGENEKKKDIVSASEDSNALMVVLIGLAVIGSLAAVVTVVRKRWQKKRKAKNRRRYGGDLI